MDFNLVLGDDMQLRSQGEVILRQGSHLMDNIVIDLRGKYVGDSAYIEFDLPKGRKFSTPTITIDGNITYAMPGDVTENSGFCYMQITILAGEIVQKSALFPFEVISSICSSHYFADKDKHDFFFNADEVIRESRAEVEAMRKANADARSSVAEMNVLKRDIEGKLQRGEFKGAKGDKGADGRNGTNGKDGINGINGIDGVNGADGANGLDGKDGVTPTIGANGHWYIAGMDTGKTAIGKDGAVGASGRDGDTPTIGVNDNWHIGGVDTGVRAKALDGKDGGPPLVQTLGNDPASAISQAAVTRELTSLYTLKRDFTGINIDFGLDSKKALVGWLYAYEKNSEKFCFVLFIGVPFSNTLPYTLGLTSLIENGLYCSSNRQFDGLELYGTNNPDDIVGCMYLRQF